MQTDLLKKQVRTHRKPLSTPNGLQTVGTTQSKIMRPLHPGYRAILVDPPWAFKVWSKKGKDKSPEKHYPTMNFDQLAELRIPAADDCAMFMWVIDTHIPEALRLIEAWGFTYKTVAFTWIKTTKDNKPAFGTGYWTRKSSEQCLLATRGKPQRLSGGVPQGILEPRREHSRKPDCIYPRIEALVPGPYFEMFSRTKREGWDSMGHDIGRWQA